MNPASGQGAIAVTGASRGIGAAIAVELARRGFTVGCLTRKGAGVEQPPAQAELSGRFIPVRCDVTDEGSLRQAFATLAERAGGLAGLVNNAGIHVEARSQEMGVDLWDRVLDTNARAVFVACREAYFYLAARGGTIVNIGSFYDKMGVKRNLAYCASKAAVGAITRCLAVEWASKGIRVVDVAPGYIKTDLNAEALSKPALAEFLAKRIPAGGPGAPEDVARLVAALFGENLPFLTGETIYLDGGQGIAL
jgi:NAD(P)-dependent dehydrogenase (short-subunit alcohol dehydrogenase family)